MKKLSRFIYGGDYNPNQWNRNVWKEDIEFFREASINSATINVFSWAKIQPSEKEYDFSELDEVVSMLSSEGYDIILGTSTAALPAWMFRKYPEVSRTDFEGRKHKFGQRHNACPNSLVYQKYATLLVEKLVDRYGNNPNVKIWHVNNEYGGECFCENCEKEFRVWLREKYLTIDAVNKAWNMEFWGHLIYSWEDIVLPTSLSEGITYEKTAFSGISLDYRRFNSDSMLNNFKMERDIIKNKYPTSLVTTNMMGTYKYLDYFKWSKEIDIISWDSYPAYNTPWSLVAMRHDLMRGLKKEPFMLMEQTPSQQNWQPYNSLKKPGQLRAQSYQTIAHGSNSIQYFQLRQSIGGCEKYHGAVIPHSNKKETRVFQEVSSIGEELIKVGPDIMSTINKSRIGIIYDWDNLWALGYSSGPNKDLDYLEVLHKYYTFFYNHNYAVDIISYEDDFDDYDLIIAPLLYMIKNQIDDRLEKFVSSGGCVVFSYLSGIVDESDNVILGGYPGPLKDLSGIWVEEIDALSPDEFNDIRLLEGNKGESRLLCDIIHLETATALAYYDSNFYKDIPCATLNSFGKGKVFYFGTDFDRDSFDVLMQQVMDTSNITKSTKSELEILYRYHDEYELVFIINFKEKIIQIPKEFIGKYDILSNKYIKETTCLKQFDVLIIKNQKK